MFRKPNRNLRVRKAESSEEEGEEERGKEEENERIRSNKQRRDGRRGLTCATRKKREERSADFPGGGSNNGDGDDDEEVLGGGQSSEEEEDDDGDGRVKLPRSGGPRSLLSFTEEREGEDVSFKVKKPSVNAVVFRVQKKTENGDHAKKQNDVVAVHSGRDSCSEPESEAESEERADSPTLDKDLTDSDASSPSQSLSDTEPTGDIPDLKTIQAARRQRRRARAQGDYLSLDTSQTRTDSSQSDSDDDLDDHEKRIQFAPGTKTLKEQMAGEISSGNESGREENQEDVDFQDRWEEQQIKKAIKFSQAVDEDMVPVRPPQRVRRAAEPRVSLPPVTVGDIKNRLAARIASFQEVHKSHTQESEKYKYDIESSKHLLEKLEKSSSEQSYKFFKEMKSYVDNYVDCLNEKISQIHELESEMFTVVHQRAGLQLQRRQEDLRNESAAILKLSGIDKESENPVANLLEDSRLRRSRRQERRELTGIKDHHEGMSSDDEMPPGEENSFQQNRARICLQSKDIFDDVHEDFHRVKNILSKFHEWRERFPDTYYDAYIGLCIPKLLNPIIRLQLLDWNPLEATTVLEDMEWYGEVEEFSYAGGDPENGVEDNTDVNILSSVIEKCVIPKVSEFVEHIWDPVSSTQTQNLVCFCKTYVLGDESKKAVEGLVGCLISRLKKAIEDDVFIPLYPKSALQDKNSPRSKFQERQFWAAVKMLNNIMLWDGFLQEEALQELGVDKLLNRYLLLILLNATPDSDMVNKSRKVVECLPQSWFKGLDSGSTLPRLANFSKHLLHSAHALHKLNDGENVAVLVSLLKKIKAFGYVDELVSKYNLKI
ncbi:intron Large complex component GCFC2 isoform X2 [Spea bombifrons]|uniref:intron Large complex component GCFC2 isoform X2 n=1 Tax=Spea bombifrons TaxID=233779 RepID=UPI00234B557C|nr:intron Large complex component GCFC2 isoform X2 [Spea bombifrons]